jgi:hypothetical protein
MSAPDLVDRFPTCPWTVKQMLRRGPLPIEVPHPLFDLVDDQNAARAEVRVMLRRGP